MSLCKWSFYKKWKIFWVAEKHHELKGLLRVGIGLTQKQAVKLARRV